MHCHVAWKPPSVTELSEVRLICIRDPDAVTSLGTDVPLNRPSDVELDDDPSSATRGCD